MWIIHAKLAAEAGALVVKAIEAVATPVQQARQEKSMQERENVSAETSAASMDDLAPEVDAATCITLWQGEVCDYGMAIDALLRRDE